MGAREQLRVRVDDELVLDAGTWEEVSGPDGPERLIRPPATTLFHQVLAYLEAMPDPPKRPSGSMVGREGVAAAALTVRWGSYLAVLLDGDKPLWPEIQSARTSRVSDEEMARINIEASAALAEWIDIYREDTGGRLYEQLVNRAVAYLPMPKKTSKLKVTEFGALAEPEMAKGVVEVADATRLERVRGDVERHPSRVLANALLNTTIPGVPTRPAARDARGGARDYGLPERAAGARDDGVPAVRHGAAPAAMAPAGAALRLGGDAADHAVAVDTHGVLAPGSAALSNSLR